ncbi:MAG: WYL domain-containing protein, partial [Bacteroidetes bacterium]|nr:WYL domain-containing protein [Bacteroidota bacterium]
DPEAYFKDCIGVNFMERVIERVVLSFSPNQGNYVKTQHLHRSQNIIKDEPDGLIVELNLIVNHELKMLILSFGDQVRVLEPVWLAEDIAKNCRNTARAYGKRTFQ